METPEKIYLVKDYNTDNPMDYWYSATTDDTKVENVRKDAFIEKAKKWFEKQNEWFDPNGNRHCDLNDFEDFRKYMEGE